MLFVSLNMAFCITHTMRQQWSLWTPMKPGPQTIYRVVSRTPALEGDPDPDPDPGNPCTDLNWTPSSFQWSKVFCLNPYSPIFRTMNQHGLHLCCKLLTSLTTFLIKLTQLICYSKLIIILSCPMLHAEWKQWNLLLSYCVTKCHQLYKRQTIFGVAKFSTTACY